MAERARTEDAGPDGGHAAVQAVSGQAAAAVSAGIDPASDAALAVVERVEAAMPDRHGDRAAAAQRIEAFTDRRMFRYWRLVGIVNAWQQLPVTDTGIEA